jgi:two-component system, LytTR family, sensor histidine kinase AlgZ
MHPILSEKRQFRFYLAGWVVIGLLVALLPVLARSLDWTFALLFSLPMTLFFAFVALSAYYLCRAFPLGQRSVLQPLLVVGAVSAVSSALWVFAGRGWYWLVNQAMGLQAPGTPPDILTALLFGTGVLLYLLSATVYYLFIESEKRSQAERRFSETRVEAREAELRALRAQIDPHFLFNSLNSISAMTTSDPPGARRMTLLLAEFLRKTVNLGMERNITVKEEIALVSAFLGIEKTRFAERLDVVIDLDPEAEDCLVPPLILQPLVENAIKHGISDVVAGGTITVRSTLKGSMLSISVENPTDNAREGTPPKEGANVGIQNVRKRLAAVYGNEARAHVLTGEGRYRVELSLPSGKEMQ